MGTTNSRHSGFDFMNDRHRIFAARVVRRNDGVIAFAGRDFAHSIQALKRVAQPDDISGAVAFLASNEARWITGETLRVDGGSKL